MGTLGGRGKARDDSGWVQIVAAEQWLAETISPSAVAVNVGPQGAASRQEPSHTLLLALV